MKTLTHHNTYTTADSAGTWLGRLRPTEVFYAKIFMIVLKASINLILEFSLSELITGQV